MKDLPPQTIEEFRTALEELRVAKEKLCRENERLTASLHVAETHCGQYRKLLELIPEVYVISNTDGTIQEANLAAHVVLKAGRDNLQGKSLQTFVPQKDLNDFKARLGRLRAVEQVLEWEPDLLSMDGVEFPASLTVAAVGDSRGHVTGLHWFIRDLTQGKKAERALQESEERHRVIFEHSPLGITHFNQNGDVVNCNRQFLKIVGAPREKVIGFNMFKSLRDPAMREAFQEAISGRIGHYEGDYCSVTGGRITPLRVLYSQVRADDGKPMGAVGIWEDITERRQAEAARRELSLQRLQACNVVAHELRNSLIKIGFVFPAINSVMSFLREQWELELRKVQPGQEDKNTLLMKLGELLLMRQPYLGDRKELTQLSEELLAEQVLVANAFFLPQHGIAWLENKMRPKWHRLLTECEAWEEYKKEVSWLLSRLEDAIRIVVDEELAKKMVHIPEDLRIQWPKLAYTEFSAANLCLLGDVLHLLDHPELNIAHKQQLRRLLTSLKALADITSLIEDRMNRMLLSLKSGEEPDEPPVKHGKIKPSKGLGFDVS